MHPTTQPSHRLPPRTEARFVDGARQAAKFFMSKSDVHLTLERLVDRLTRLEIPHAIVGAMALNAYGYQRMTTDVHVLVRPEGLKAFKDAYLERGYVETFPQRGTNGKQPGSKGMRDTVQNVKIDVLITGEYPGDGKEKPVAFPDPAAKAVRGERFALLPLETLIELKLASGLTAPHRLRDLADVIELVRVNSLSREFSESLDPYVREKYLELWQAAQAGDDE